jgi:hypothetical protein
MKPGVSPEHRGQDDVEMPTLLNFMNELPSGRRQVSDAAPFNHVLQLYRTGPVVGGGKSGQMQGRQEQQPARAGDKQIDDGGQISSQDGIAGPAGEQ